MSIKGSSAMTCMYLTVPVSEEAHAKEDLQLFCTVICQQTLTVVAEFKEAQEANLIFNADKQQQQI